MTKIRLEGYDKNNIGELTITLNTNLDDVEGQIDRIIRKAEKLKKILNNESFERNVYVDELLKEVNK